MSLENPQSNESQILWSKTAERLAEKISTEKEDYLKIHGDNGDDNLQILNDLESSIIESFSVYERNNRSMTYVEDDLRYKIKNETDKTKKTIDEQTLAMIQIRKGPLF